MENIYSGVRQAFETNAASRPWMQLDMGEEVTVKKVTEGVLTDCGGGDGEEHILLDNQIKRNRQTKSAMQVWFESGICTACDGAAGDITGQDSEVTKETQRVVTRYIDILDISILLSC